MGKRLKDLKNRVDLKLSYQITNRIEIYFNKKISIRK